MALAMLGNKFDTSEFKGVNKKETTPVNAESKPFNNALINFVRPRS